MSNAKLIAFSVIGISLMLLLALCSVFVDVSQNEDCVPAGTTSAGTGVPILDNINALSVKGTAISTPQAKNAEAIARAGLDNGASIRDIEIAIMTAIQESVLLNLLYGYPGSTSLGLFQQIEAWGPRKVRIDPYKSAVMFFVGGGQGQAGLLDIADRDVMTRAEAAQAVQDSGYPEAYAAHEEEAIAIVSDLTSASGGISGSDSEDCITEDPVELAVQEALNRQGEPYAWGDSEGSGFISSVFETVNITVPTTITELLDFEGSPEQGVTVEHIDPSTITNPGDLQRGDIVSWSTDENEEPEHSGLNLGTSLASKHRFATYNILGSNHTSQSSARSRIQFSARLIKENNLGVIGLQELRNDQRGWLLGLLDGNYGIYPKKPMYGKDAVSVNSIIWDERRYELVSAKLTPMKYYFKKVPTDIPLLQLKDKWSGHEFWVINTHDPARPENAKLRFINAKAHAKLINKLSLTGLPIVFTGDFNSGYAVRYARPNRTWQDKRKNLTWCIMTKSGIVVNAYDALKGRSGCSPITSREKGIGIVDHLYVSRDMSVDNYVVEWDQTGSDHPLVFIDAKISLSQGGSSSKSKSDSHSFYIGKKGRQIGIGQFDVRDLTSVIRLSVTDPVMTLDSAGEWVFPLAKGTYTYTHNSYGPRLLNGDDYHNGTDFGTSGETPPLYAMYSGEVIRFGWGGAWGNYYVVETGIQVPDEPGNTYKYLYGHMSSFAPGIQLGSEVEIGQYLGNVGNTGNSFGEHLHLTICTSIECTYGNQEGTVDPVTFLVSVGLQP